MLEDGKHCTNYSLSLCLMWLGFAYLFLLRGNINHKNVRLVNPVFPFRRFVLHFYLVSWKAHLRNCSKEWKPPCETWKGPCTAKGKCWIQYISCQLQRSNIASSVHCTKHRVLTEKFGRKNEREKREVN